MFGVRLIGVEVSVKGKILSSKELAANQSFFIDKKLNFWTPITETRMMKKSRWKGGNNGQPTSEIKNIEHRMLNIE